MIVWIYFFRTVLFLLISSFLYPRNTTFLVISNSGWTAILEPADHPVNNYEFDFIVGADGKRNSLKGFKRKCFRAKQAIAITFNLVNNKTKVDSQVW